jgi:transcriptional regulator GlxA family with amidase domain
MRRHRAGILIFDEVEVLDFCGPFEVLSVTRLDESRRREEPSPFEVLLVAERAGQVVATGGLRVVPDVTCEACLPLDVLSCPGVGDGAHSQHGLLGWIADRGGRSRY